MLVASAQVRDGRQGSWDEVSDQPLVLSDEKTSDTHSSEHVYRNCLNGPLDYQ